MRARHVMLVGVVLACSRREPVPVPKPLWAFSSTSYFSQRDFLDASAFSRELAVLGDAPGTGVMFGVRALDATTGVELWSKRQIGWLVHPPHATEPLYFVPEDSSMGFSHADRLDPRTGRVVATIPIDVRGDTVRTTIMWSPRGVLALGNGVMSLFDWQTGRPLWATPIDTPYLRPPTFAGDRVVVPGEPTRAFALADGAMVATIDGVCCGVVASPDGRHVFVKGAHDTTIELDGDLRVMGRRAGAVIAASNTRFVVETYGDGNEPSTFAAYAYGAQAPTAVLAPSDAHDHYAAIGIDGDELFYVHAGDATLFERDLATGTSRVLDRVGSAGLSATAPIIERPYLFAQLGGEHGVFAYRVGD